MSTTAPAPAPDATKEEPALKPSKDEGDGSSWVAKLTLLFVCVLFTIPTFGLLISSFRDPQAIRQTGWWTVITGGETFSLDNYTTVLNAGMGESFVNSLTVAIPATVIPIMAAAFAAYAFAWMDFKGREFLFVIFVGLLVVPLQVALIPLTRLYNTVGINNDFVKLWLAHTGFGMPLAVYILRNYIGSLPREIIESAKVDGASHFATFWRLILPLSVPALAAFAIFQFLWTWNDYLVALVFMTSGAEVVTVTLAELVGSRGQDWHLLTAGAFISMVVPLIVFFALQRFFVRGLTAGSVKG
ncbi:MAG: carbohydrate ABC transporter permease [Nitriliruptoraceae bacterium]|nr:carbohydrate ABC transporter permease [Nitriliruptoraceae bacterium]